MLVTFVHEAAGRQRKEKLPTNIGAYIVIAGCVLWVLPCRRASTRSVPIHKPTAGSRCLPPSTADGLASPPVRRDYPSHG